MNGLLGTLRNIFKITELKNRILYTLILLALYRFGSFVILPGINSRILEDEFARSQGTGILGLVNIFVGGSFSRGSIFALGIMPYISASIIIQLAMAVVPALQKMQKEGDTGQRKINQLMRTLTIGIAFFQGLAYITNLRTSFPNAIVADAVIFTVTTIFVLTAGTIFLMWLGERITENGIGNGTSLIIAIGIIAELPLALINEAQTSTPMLFFIELLALAAITMIVILLTQGTRKIAVNYARRMVGNRMSGGMTNNVRQYIPLKLNAAGVMPIIFAQSLMFIPATILQFTATSDNGFFSGIATTLANPYGWTYNIIFVLLIVVFTYFYTAIAVNPNDMADQLKRNGGFVPGVKPGKKTSEFIDGVVTRITLPGSFFLAFIAVLPAIVVNFGVSTQFAQFFGGTSILIMIGVVLDTLQQIESYLLMRHYDGLMRSGRARARSTTPATA